MPSTRLTKNRSSLLVLQARSFACDYINDFAVDDKDNDDKDDDDDDDDDHNDDNDDNDDE